MIEDVKAAWGYWLPTGPEGIDINHPGPKQIGAELAMIEGDYAYQRAANPAVMLKLLDQLAEAQSERDELAREKAAYESPAWEANERLNVLVDELVAERADAWVIAGQAMQNAEHLVAKVARLRELLQRYRTETPLGHQPHMIAHAAADALADTAP